MSSTSTDEIWRQELTTAGLAALGARNDCDREEIHRSGAIQPHGFLLVLDPATLRVEAVSANLTQWTGHEPGAVMEHALDAVLGAELAALVGHVAKQPRLDEINPIPISLPSPGGGHGLDHFEMVLHRSDPWILLDLEPAVPLSDRGLIGFYQTLGRIMERLHEADNVDALCQLAVHELRALTGYDRVMVYRFDTDAHGQVIAEEHAAEQESYLGLHYPAGDIPRQARILYFRNRLRLIAAVDGRPIPLLTSPRLPGPQALDLSLSALRSVSPLHLQYLRNMGVAATMSVSLIIDDRLWGMLACHHRTPMRVSARVRTACEMIGQLLSLQVRAAQTRQEHSYEARLARLGAQTVSAMAAGESIPAGAAATPETLLGMLDADAAVIQIAGERVCVGHPLPTATLDRLLPRLAALAETQAPPLVTDALPALLADETGRPGSGADATTDPDLRRLAAGAVYLAVGHRDGDFILWLRQERAETVRWAGTVGLDGRRVEPASAPTDPAGTLSPGRSFAEWCETVRGRSRPWLRAEIGAARDLAQALPELLLRRARQRLIGLTLHDSLTGLPNRAMLLKRLREAQLRGTCIAAIYVDLDRFKAINETYGPQAGDVVLAEAARRLSTAVRPADTLARLGGDEFVLLIRDLADPEEAVATAGRILDGLRSPFFLTPQIAVRVTASIGVSGPRGPGDAAEVLYQADRARYHAKRAGRDQVARYDPDWSVATSEAAQLEDELRQGIAHGELVLHYQPVFDLLGRGDNQTDRSLHGGYRLRGVEALVRWQHPTRGLVGPNDFIPLAEETGLVHGIWDFVLGETLRQLLVWQRPDLQGSVNVSACQLAAPGFARSVLERLHQAGIAPSQLCIEVTETQVMAHPDQAASVLAELTGAGVVIAIDDFGVGYSSLAYARNLPARILKIDRSFVAGLPHNSRDLTLVSSTVRLAHELGMITIGEGVETAAQLECLRELGCDSVQGYLLARPTAPEQIAGLEHCSS